MNAPVMTDSAPCRGWTRSGLPRDLVLVAAVCAIVFFAGIGRSPLWDEDETRFASVAREMLATGDWIIPRFNGELADKPAGLFWMIAAGFAVFGESPGAARVGSAVCGLLTVAMVWLLGRRLFGRSTAFWGALATGTSLLVAVEARAATADAALLAVITAMMVVAAGAWWKEKRFVPAAWPREVALSIGALAGVGILLKGLVAIVVPLVAFFLFYWWAFSSRSPITRPRMRDAWSCFRAVRPVLVVATAVLIALPWHVAVGLKTGGEWFELFYWKHHFGRAVGVMEGHGGVPFLQILFLLAGMFPWSVFLPLAVWRTWRSALSRGDADNEASKLMICWSAVWLVLFSLTATQLPNYVLPAYPALGLCVGRLLARATNRPDSMRNGWFYAACGGLCLGAAVFAGGVWGLSAFLDAPMVKNLSWLAFVPLAAATGMGIAVAVGLRAIGTGVVGVASVILLLGLFLVAAPKIGSLDPIAPLIAHADLVAKGRAQIGTWRFSAPGVVWHSARSVRICSSAQEAADFVESEPGKAALLIDEAGFAELSRAARCEIKVLADGRPLFRRGKVLLVGAE